MFSNRWAKIWIVVALCAVLAYDLYWLLRAIVSPYFLSYGKLPENFPPLSIFIPLDYVLPVMGEIFRLIGLLLGLFSIYLIWGPKSKPFSNVKTKIAISLLFEGIYFLSILPLNILFIAYAGPLPLFLGFVLQILIISPLLFALSFKIWHYQETDKTNILKWVSLAAIGYLVGIWINNVFKWLSMATLSGIGFILKGVTSIGFLNSILTLSLSLSLAVAGFYALLRKNSKKMSKPLFAFALIMLSLHFAIFILFSGITNAWSWVPLTEIWPIALLGLGFQLLRKEK
jgi:hypothetical protein